MENGFHCGEATGKLDVVEPGFEVEDSIGVGQKLLIPCRNLMCRSKVSERREKDLEKYKMN